MAFDSDARNKLARMVAQARQLLTDEFTQQLQEIYGIQPDGTITALEKFTHLDDEQAGTAKFLRERIGHLVSGMTTEKKPVVAAINRTIREQAFTILNRFAALRVCEERNLVEECVRAGIQSKGFKVYETIVGSGLGNIYERYKTFLFCLFDEIAVDLGVLFDRFSPQGLLFPREQALLGLLTIINNDDLSKLWAEDETIGWIYQYFNPREERKAMRKASRAPRNSLELAVRNQFFTPRYVVEFLTDNTLGRIWYEMRRADTALKEECRYLVRRPNEVFLWPGEKVPAEPKNETDLSQEELLKKTVHIEHRPKKDPRDLRVLDPACGSGHFLLYAFDLLERIYVEAWADVDSPKSEITGHSLREEFETLEELRRSVPKLIIEHNLHGIDIDPRAVQIAVLALWLRAQKTWKSLSTKAAERPRVAKSNIVTAEPMPGEEDMRREFTTGLKPRVLGQLVDVVFDKMNLAGEAGSLLKIEEEIKDAVADARKQWLEDPKPEQQLLFPSMADPQPKQEELRFDFKEVTDELFWEQAEDHILDALKDYAERAENGHAIRRRLFAEDAARGFAFIDLCRKRYDAILMNPPFGESSRESKDYIEDRYPKTKGDVLANFIERTLHLTDKSGRVGAISSRTPFFLSSFETLRTEVLGKIGHVHLLADLGQGVLEAMVETAIYVMTGNRRGEPESLFFRLLIDAEKGEILQQLTNKCLDACVSDRTFVINPRHFETLNKSPYAYWVSRATIEQISVHRPIEGNQCSIRVGLQTGDDFRYLRLLWEIRQRDLVPRNPVVDRYKLLQKQCVEQLCRGGRWVPLLKTDKASPWFSPITLVVDWAENGKELKNFTDRKGKLRSRPQNESFYFRPGFSYMLRSTRIVPYLAPSGAIPAAPVSEVFPNNSQEYAVLGICASNIGSAVARFKGGWFSRAVFQASLVQDLPACDFPEETLALIKEHVDVEVNKRRAVVQRYEPFQEFALPAWIQTAEGGETAWDLYSLFGRGLENKIAEAFGLRSEQFVELERDIREAVSIRGRSEDVESEDTSEDSSEDEQEMNIELISETPGEKAVGLFAYVVGVALGRWDVRIAMDPSLTPKLPDPFDPLPVCPPGMLVGPDGLPTDSGRIVSKEWLRARPNAITLPLEGEVNNTTISDSEYPLRIHWNGILVDNPEHSDDIVRSVRDVLEVIWKDRAEAIEKEASEILGVRELRDYFRRPSGFFQDHLKRYSKSRRKAPIYWPLSTKSGSYTLWIYYHRLTSQTLYACVNDYVNPKLNNISKDIIRLQEEVSKQGSTKNRQRLEQLMHFERELKDYRDELLRVTGLPYKPNLNDGVMITAAPLWKLFRHNQWRKDLEACWKKLKEGEYDWTHLAYVIWPDRVKKICRTDLSIAIAHDLEDLYEGDDIKPKGGRGKAKV